VNLFYESSTRTLASFELARKAVADTMSIRLAGSSVDKGESLKDTALTLRRTTPTSSSCGIRHRRPRSSSRG
jgi:aspartate carbamoyltransferase catalytic subunit